MVKDLQCAWLMLLHCAAATSSDPSDLQPQNNSQEPTTKVFCSVWPDLGQCTEAVRVGDSSTPAGRHGFNQCDKHEGDQRIGAVGLTVCP